MEGTTIVLVTHDLALAKSADRVVQMKDGNITIYELVYHACINIPIKKVSITNKIFI